MPSVGALLSPVPSSRRLFFPYALLRGPSAQLLAREGGAVVGVVVMGCGGRRRSGIPGGW